MSDVMIIMYITTDGDQHCFRTLRPGFVVYLSDLRNTEYYHPDVRLQR